VTHQITQALAIIRRIYPLADSSNAGCSTPN